jgi:hypothetical protein
MWIAVSLSALALSQVRRAAAVGTVALGVLGTLAILLFVRTVPE